MSNEIQIFTNEAFGNVRVVVDGDKTLFCGSDIAKSLGYARPADAVTAHCKGVCVLPTPSVGGVQNTKFISEGDVYRLITHSKLPAAEQFEHWVFDEVLPSIRKHGLYAVDELLADPDVAIKAFTALKEEREKRKALEIKVKEDAPKVLFANAVETAHTSILIGDLAKILRQNGVHTGQKRLFELLRNEGYLMKRGESYNMPTQKAMELGLFEVKERTIKNPDDTTMLVRTTMVTGRGQTYFVNKFLSGESTDYSIVANM